MENDPNKRTKDLYFGFFKIIFLKNKPDQNFFLNLVFLNRVSPVDATYKGVTPYALSRLGSTLSHSPAMWTKSRRGSHASSFSVTGPPRGY
jgi:hypothetical protein